MSLQLPRVNGGGSIPIAVTNVTTKIGDTTALTQFAALLLGSEILRVAIRGRATLWAGKLHTKVNYNEVVTMNGRVTFLSAGLAFIRTDGGECILRLQPAEGNGDYAILAFLYKAR